MNLKNAHKITVVLSAVSFLISVTAQAWLAFSLAAIYLALLSVYFGMMRHD